MNNQTKKLNTEHSYMIMTLILDEHQSQKFVRAAKEKDISGAMIVIGRGTVKNAILNLLGIKSQKKEVVSILIKEEKSKEILDFFSNELQLRKHGHGIAFMAPVMTAEEILNKKDNNLDIAQNLEGENMFKKLTVIVNRGMAEDVMDIARKSGVKGGTIMHGRGAGSEFTEKLFGMEIEPEKELVMILMPSKLLDDVVLKLYEELQLDVAGNGILFVESIMDVRGLVESQSDKGE